MSVEPSSSAPPRDRPSWRKRSRRWPGWLGLAALIGLPVLSTLMVLWTTDDPAEDEAEDEATVVDAGMSHVHGLGVNPGDGATYLATHSGIFRIVEGEAPIRVADRHQDTMGFTVVGPNRFLASGHPDLTDESMPTHLGLIESTDAAESWQERSLGGEADLHALDAGPAGVVAFDAVTGRLLSSETGQSWKVLAQGVVIDVAADPGNGGAVMVTTREGELVVYDSRGRGEELREAPPVGLVDWPRPDLLIAVGADGQLHRSADRGKSWERVGRPLGAAQAIDVTDEAWLVANQEAVLRSTDEGKTWQTLVEFAS
jgi:hypothetical protein